MDFEKDCYGSFGGLLTVETGDKPVVIQGIPYEAATSGKKGTSYAVKALRAISEDMQTLSRNGTDITGLSLIDAGDVVLYPLDGTETRKSIEECFLGLRKKYRSPVISIGGDHSVTFPLIKALQQEGRTGIVWFDAHRDLLDDFLNSPYSHGTSLRRAIETDNVNAEDVMLVGTRYFTREEEDYVHKMGVNEIRKSDMERSSDWIADFQKKLEEISGRVDHLYVSLDIDGLDPSCAPGTGTPVAGGVQSADLFRMIEAIKVPVTAYDIVEVSPPLDVSGITVKAMMGLLTEILAQIRTVYYN